jgi:cytochrome c
MKISGLACALATALVMAMPAAATEADAENPETMIELAWDSGCFNCHDLDQTVRGPAWRDVAKRYRGDAEAFARLREKIRDGGSGSWGDDRMSPNRRVPMEDIDRLLAWLLTLDDPVEAAEQP